MTESEFRRMEGKAYAWCKLFATGERSPSDPLFLAWYGQAVTLEATPLPPAGEYPEDPYVP